MGIYASLNGSFPYFCSSPTKRPVPSLPSTTADVFTTQPLDVLQALLPYLDDKSFLNLLSTCTFLRHHALTTFQAHSRLRVLALRWAVPTTVEYQIVVRRKFSTSGPPSADDLAAMEMAHATHSPLDADWHMYLAKVYCSHAMRARRWTWTLACEVARVYRAKRAAGPYADRFVDSEDGHRVVRSTAWVEYASCVLEQLKLRSMIQGSELGRAQAAGAF